MLALFICICFIALYFAPAFGGYGDNSSLEEYASRSTHFSSGGGAK